MYILLGVSLLAMRYLTSSTLYFAVAFAAMNLIYAGSAGAQTFRSLYVFSTRSETGTNMDGARPKGGLTRSGIYLYGTAIEGGAAAKGTVFRVNLDGTGFMTLHDFTAVQPPLNSNSDGANPQAGVIISGNTLYGTALAGGDVGYGTVFRVNTDGTDFMTLHSFHGSNIDGNSPQGPLLLVGDVLYGASGGNVFKVNTNGTGFSIVHMFGGTNPPTLGLDPSHCGLVISGNTLYGTTSSGGSSYGMPVGFSGSGTVFSVDTDGSNFRILHNFSVIDDVTSANFDGANPLGRLVLDGNTLYGTANFGGNATRGTVWSVDTEGNDFTVLHTFSALTNFMNLDGAFPVAGLALGGNKLFGTTTIGGMVASGTVFSVKTDGTGFDKIYDFHNGLGGGSDSPLIFDNNIVRGTLPLFPSGGIFSITRIRTPFDYDADNQTDLSVFRPSSGAWYIQKTHDGFYGAEFGFSSDKLAPADYDGDARTDIAVYRPSTGIWYVFNSSDGTVSYNVFGIAEDLPVPADYDVDGKADIAVFRPSTATWYRQNSGDGSFYAIQFGASEDKPTIGDFDADGKADIAIFRPSVGAWYQLYSSDNSLHGAQFGFGTDIIVPADYDGDGRVDIAVYRPSTGLWYIAESASGQVAYAVFGLESDIPAPGDFDGDGKSDISVFRPSDGVWYRTNSSDGSFAAYQFGAGGDQPTQTAFRF
jgi:uncharacterized repeat protein (TIGR03803 family)